MAAGSKLLEYIRTLSQRMLAIIIFLLTWELAVRSGLTYPSPIPSMSSVFINLKDLLLMEVFWKNTFVSMLRICSGYLLAAMIAVPLGLVIGWFNGLEKYIDPLFHVLRNIPLLALFPVFVIIFGIGELSRILTIMLAAMWWILLSTISAVHNVDPFLVKTARSMGASQWDLLTEVVLPSSIPPIFVGLRYAYTEIILILLAVETLGAETGWGVIAGAHEHHGQNHILMYGIIIFMTTVGVAANYVLTAVEKNMCGWKESNDTG